MVRAWLLVTVLMLWAACLAGAVGLPLVLAARAWFGRRRTATAALASPMVASASAGHAPPAPSTLDVAPPADYGLIIVLLYGYAAAMGLGALFLSGQLFAPMGDDLGDTLAWVALPLWSAVMALLVARSLRSPQRVRGSMR